MERYSGVTPVTLAHWYLRQSVFTFLWGYSQINSPRATVPTGAICVWSKKKTPKRSSYSYISKHTGGVKNINLQSKRQLLWNGKSYLPPSQSAPRPPPTPPVHSSISDIYYNPLYTSGRGIYYSSPSLWNDGLWSHLSSFNPVRCASIFWWSLWRRSFTRGRRARHLSPLVRYEAGPYDFCDAKNADGIMESSNEFTINLTFNMYYIMQNVTEFKFNMKQLWQKYITTIQQNVVLKVIIITFSSMF